MQIVTVGSIGRPFRAQYMVVCQPRAMPWADIVRPFGAKRAKYSGVFFVGNHLSVKINTFVSIDKLGIGI